VATRASYSYFTGSKRQVTNQWIQCFLLIFVFGVLIRGAYSAAGIRNEGWWMLAYLVKSGVSWGAAFWLIRGRLGEYLNGPRLPEPIPDEQPEPEPLRLYYYPSGCTTSTERVPKRRPIRQPEEN
jgi:hypothetical protein